MGSSLSMAAAVTMTVVTVALTACDQRPTPMTAQLQPGPGAQAPPIPDPHDLPALPGQLVFVQPAGEGMEVVRWPPRGGAFETLAVAGVVGALEVAESGTLAAYLEQDPKASTGEGTVHVIDMARDVPLEVAAWPATTSDDFRLDSADSVGQRLSVNSQGSAVAWRVAGSNPAVAVWRQWVVGEAAPRTETIETNLAAGDLSPFGDVPELGDASIPPESMRGLEVAARQPDGPLVLFSDGGYGQDAFTAILTRTDTADSWDLSGLLYGARFMRLAGAASAGAP